VLLGAGLFASAGFFLYEASTNRHTRKASQELLLGIQASVLLGLGVLFLLLWTGVYV
jgi:ABC-type Mn2+/Zn2+ transport system permease subunit